MITPRAHSTPTRIDGSAGDRGDPLLMVGFTRGAPPTAYYQPAPRAIEVRRARMQERIDLEKYRTSLKYDEVVARAEARRSKKGKAR